MGFTNRKTVPAQESVTELTPTQKDTICDLFAEGKGAVKIKHSIFRDFPGGKRFHHLLKPAINKMKRIEKELHALVQADPDCTAATTLATLKGMHPGCNAASLKHLCQAIVKATGTWAEYKETIPYVEPTPDPIVEDADE